MRFVVIAAVALGAGLATDAAWAQAPSEFAELAAMPLTGRFDYQVIRAGQNIGTHSITFRRDGRHITVATHTDVAIDLLGITVFRFDHEAEEDWIDGRLTRLTARTDDDGDEVTFDLKLVGDRLRGTCNGAVLDLPAELLPASLWHPEIVRQSALLDPYKCAERQVRVDDHGMEPIVVGGHELAARHFAIGGELTRDIWYGPDGQIVQVRFPAKDDSEITFVPMTSAEAPVVASQSVSTSPIGFARVEASCSRNC